MRFSPGCSCCGVEFPCVTALCGGPLPATLFLTWSGGVGRPSGNYALLDGTYALTYPTVEPGGSNQWGSPQFSFNGRSSNYFALSCVNIAGTDRWVPDVNLYNPISGIQGSAPLGVVSSSCPPLSMSFDVMDPSSTGVVVGHVIITQ